MKKIIGVLSIVLLSITINAQEFVVTPNGLRNSTDVSKTFVVINIEDQSAEQLFQGVKKYIVHTYKNPEYVISGSIENEFVSFKTHVQTITTLKVGFTKCHYSANYNTEISFRDNTIKIEFVGLEIESEGSPLQFKQQNLMGWFIYNKQEVLKRPNCKIDIENYFNFKIDSIIKELTTPTSLKKW